jgi:hypothetical protein
VDGVLLPNGATKLDPVDSNDVQSGGTSVDPTVVGVMSRDSSAAPASTIPLYGITFSSGTAYLTTVNSVTGATTLVGTGLPGVTGVRLGAEAARDGKLDFVGADFTFYVVDENTGGVISDDKNFRHHPSRR